jgi:thiol:disulfide interchange protein
MQVVKFGIVLCTAISTSAIAQTSTTIVPTVAQASNTSGNTQGPVVQKILPSAQQLIAEGIKAAKASHKTVFVHFGNEGCGWCHVLEKFLHSSQASSIMAAHYVFVSLTVASPSANPGADSTMKAMHLGEGLPEYAFLDSNGKQIASSMVMPPDGGDIGYPMKPEEIKQFDALLKKTAPRMTDADRAKVDEVLAHPSKFVSDH